MTDVDGKKDAEEVVAVRRRTRGKVEEEVIVALAEVMEEYSLPLRGQSKNDGGPKSDWESEFAQDTSGTTGGSEFIYAVSQTVTSNFCFHKGVIATLIFVLSSQVLPFVAEDRLRALPLEVSLYVLLLGDHH